MKTTYLLAVLLLVAGCKKSDLGQKLNAGDVKKSLAVRSSATGDVVGKIAVGYQGWFSCLNDGSPYQDGWWHWSSDSKLPTINNKANKSWPDTREYTTLYNTGFANLGNGQPAALFSSYDNQVVDTHFKWMQQNGIDAAALQRFNPSGNAFGDAVIQKAKTAAEAHGVKFYIMYDLSGWTSFQQEIKADWSSKMAVYTTSNAYARQNGKPVVCLWGLGFENRPLTPAAELDVINWFKNQGCYVIGGVPSDWHNYSIPAKQSFDVVFKALNMISPWMIGAIGSSQESDSFYNTVNIPDVAYCKLNGLDYQPCVEPGDLSVNQRVHGDFMWHQFYNMIRAGAQGIYISMFDEYGEGNQIAKSGEDASMVPVGSGILGLDEDGVPCSSDYYLRLTNDGGKMLKGILPLTPLRPTEPIIGKGTAHLPPLNQSVAIMGDNNLYVGGENGNGPMYCHKVSPGIWETFKIIDAGNGKVALMSMDKYVSSENGGAPLTCNRTAIGPWEQFDYIINSDGSVSFRGNNGKYVTREDGTTPMICDRSVVGIWERFTVN